jgi:hypothetical protein
MANQRSQGGGVILLGGLAVVIVVLALVFLHSRGSGGGNNNMAIPAPAAETAELSPAIDINVYIDGSGSIKHFLQKPSGSTDGPAPPNYFKGLLDKCETSLHNAPGAGGWRDVNLQFFRFGSGSRPTPIPANGGLQRMSTDLAQFSESNTLIETPIQHTVHNNSGEPRAELKIIFTDLYQSGSQLEKPADALADKYLHSETGAVAVLAVRSSFNGPVEDLPGTPRGGSLADAADTMPFYILIAGEAPDVRQAMQALIDGTGLRGALDRKLATEFFFTRAPQTRSEPPMKFSGAAYSTLSSNYNGTHIQSISLTRGVLRATWTDPRDSDPQSVALGDASELVPTASVVGAGKPLRNDPAAASAAQPCGGADPLCILLDRAKLTAGTTYVFRFDAVSRRESAALAPDSEQLAPWNIEVPDAERISSSAHPQFPPIPGVRVGERPGRTPDLSKFLMALQGQMFHSPVRTASYFLYVQAN